MTATIRELSTDFGASAGGYVENRIREPLIQRHWAAAEALHSQEEFGVFRERDINGNQIVRCGKYSYTWPADREPLTMGDTVELPPPVSADGRETYGDQPRQTTVTHLGTYYSGPFVRVVRLVKRASPHDPENPDDINGPPPRAPGG